ncbi:hypothetical protein K461DRAFT_129883 [Myriangium duriaei CBS 260.36]|uniref:Uncharacterized protein n=1 Tax=Myriangium duriaei CBS 260.36 TaxID=1168546 RepID=A0A9P4MIR7_9PEZI|nr:hypothetical protein K461DRAFT_129883 [Myriangium duriaei CBS 260.36]
MLDRMFTKEDLLLLCLCEISARSSCWRLYILAHSVASQPVSGFAKGRICVSHTASDFFVWGCSSICRTKLLRHTAGLSSNVEFRRKSSKSTKVSITIFVARILMSPRDQGLISFVVIASMFTHAVRLWISFAH